MKTFFVWLWFLIGIFMAFNNNLDACINCFIMSKLFDIEKKLDLPFMIVDNTEYKGDENVER